MALCPACRGDVAGDDKYCKHCGSLLPHKVTPSAKPTISTEHAVGAGHWETCPDCHGMSSVSCPRCTKRASSEESRTGRDPCPVCRGSLKVKCPNLECQRGRVWVRD
jgi:hypothetical protein